MKNQLTIVIPFYNMASHIEACIMSVIQQTNQNFELLVVNDGSTDASKTMITTLLAQHQRTYQCIDLDVNHGHSYARNVGMEHVQTPYFMFLDADDTLTPYAVDVYLAHLDDQDVLITPIHDFSTEPQTAYDSDALVVRYGNFHTEPTTLIEQQSVCNIVFKTSMIRENHLALNTDLNVYADLSLLIDYSLSSTNFVALSGAPFYYRGEVYDPFEATQLSEQSLDKRFNDYVKAFDDARARTQNHPQMYQYVLSMMQSFVRDEFEPGLYDIAYRYKQYGGRLAELTRHLKPVMKYEKNPFIKLEMACLNKKWVSSARLVNKARYRMRFIKDFIFNRSRRPYAKYMLFNSERVVDNETIVFESFGGKTYNDSPKYIYEYMKTHYPQYKYYWIFQDVNDSTLPEECHKIQKGSPDYFEIFKKAHIWVSNARLPVYMKKKKNQYYIQTWHGTPLKRLANDMQKVRIPNTTTADYKYHFYWATRRWDYLVSPNPYSTEIFQSAFWMHPDQILEIGYPRNDILVTRQDDHVFHDTIRQQLGIPKHKKVILYAPTWRDDEFIETEENQFDLQLDLKKFKQTLGDDYVILLRMHYFIDDPMDLSGMEGFAVDVSTYKDVSELYLISDVLVTDYSSVMFDFGVLKRPQLFYAYDIEKYDKDLRGFYIDYHKDLPGPVYETSDELLKGLQNLETIARDYEDNIEAFYQRFCSIDNGLASEYIGELIHQKIQQKAKKS